MSDEDEDDVSVTSTVESEQQSEYEVERILAETQLDGAKTYLVRWAHYPIERSTWEPADSFYDPQTLTDWEKTKELIENGKREAFDLDAFSKHLDALERASANRRSKREAKRRRLGYYGGSTDLQEDATASLSPPAANSPQKDSSQAFVAPRPPQALPPDNSRVRTVADKPPVAVFGNSESAPRGPLRRKKPAEQEPAKRFKLSTMRSYEKAKSYEPAPNASQLERWRPSEWPSAASGATGLGNKPVRSLEGQVPTISARQSDDLFVNPGSRSPGPAVDSPITPREVQNHRDSGTGHPLPEPSTERHVATRDHQAETGRMSDYARGRELEANRPLRLPPRVPQPGSYKMKDRFWNRGEVLIHMFYGPDKTEIGSARICGLPPQYKKRLVDTKKTPRFDLWFQHLCTYEEYSILCEESRVNIKHCNGWIEGFDDTEPNVYRLGEYLGKEGLVAIFYPDNISQDVLLAYSPGSSMFDFLNGPRCPDTAFLSIAVRNVLAPISRLGRRLGGGVNPQAAPSQPSPLQRAPLQPAPSRPAPSVREQQVPEGHAQADLDAFFKERFRITFNDLATVPDSKGSIGGRSVRAFYLMCPLDDHSIETEFKPLTSFLKSGRDLAIYSNRDPEDWTKFIMSCQNGAIMFHESITDYYTLRDLQKAIRRPFNFWTFSLAKPLENADRPVHFQRIFPQGAVILLTEEFMKREPDATIITLAWFNDFIKRKLSGSWKIMLRPSVLSWLAKWLENENDGVMTGKVVAMYQLITKANTFGPNSDLTEYGPHSIYHDFDNASVVSPLRMPNYGVRQKSDYPNLPVGLTQPQRNADHLIEFFAGWALANSHKFRRFTVVTAVKPVQRWEPWNHLDIRNDAADFLRTFDIDCGEYWRKLGMQGECSVMLPSRPPPPRGQANQPTSAHASWASNPGAQSERDAPRRGGYW